jgi:DNA polymerase III alpha subunit (gram-positive type)
MKFIKDLLIVSVETTGLNPERDSIIQLSAVLLDKDNLLEKNSFNSYVKASFLDSKILEHSKQLGVPVDIINKSPKSVEVLRKFSETFGTEPLITVHGFSTILFLKQAYKKHGLDFGFDSHYIDIWTLGYIYTLHYGIKKIPSFSTLLDHFRVKQENPNNALERVKNNATIFKQIIGKS